MRRQHGKPKKNPDAADAAAPTCRPNLLAAQLIVRVRQADGTVRRVAFDDGAASLDDLRAESGADELFADEACTRACTAADLVHGAVVYARHNAAEDEEGGDAMASTRRPTVAMATVVGAAVETPPARQQLSAPTP